MGKERKGGNASGGELLQREPAPRVSSTCPAGRRISSADGWARRRRPRAACGWGEGAAGVGPRSGGDKANGARKRWAAAAR